MAIGYKRYDHIGCKVPVWGGGNQNFTFEVDCKKLTGSCMNFGIMIFFFLQINENISMRRYIEV